jgi:hypothetical protein
MLNGGFQLIMLAKAPNKCVEVIPFWWHWFPPIGVSIGLLGFLGVFVPWYFGDRSTKAQKGIWSSLMFLLLCLEIGTIYVDRAHHDRDERFASCEQQKRFEETATGIDTAIADGKIQLKKLGDVVARQDRTLTQTIGGTSYPLFIATASLAPNSTELPVLVITPGAAWHHNHVPSAEETAPLPDVTVDLTEFAIKDENTTPAELETALHPIHYNLGTIMVPGVFTAPFKLNMGERANLIITTRRGTFREAIDLERDGSTWHQHWCMYGRRMVSKRGTVTGDEHLLAGENCEPSRESTTKRGH